ncbi:iron-sulfur cluster repair di-iron protein [Neorhodopirellula lusitana]|uniref:iron-sulfur cluster repair di-iron protein n=1 Tax=Neorhodopirellula lusitana TaxID=445327 RepID=UPI00384AB854
MLTLDPTATVGSFVRERPSRSRVFENLKIDYCCGGKIPLAQACEKKGIDTNDVLQQIEASDAAADHSGLADADAMSLTDLADHIESTHHAYLREELPRLDFMTEKVSRVHGDKDARLLKMREAFVALKAELDPHMVKEEEILFPLIRQMEAVQPNKTIYAEEVASSIRDMEHEHDHAGNALEILRKVTDGYVPPEWACNTYRAMLDSLEKLESDMHQHVHKENNVLFIKALEQEHART